MRVGSQIDSLTRKLGTPEKNWGETNALWSFDEWKAIKSASALAFHLWYRVPEVISLPAVPE
jgi:hypothetical protein